MKLSKSALGVSLGIVWGASVFLATVWVLVRGGGEHLQLLGQFYIGYRITYLGAIVGLVEGFVDGFIGGWLIAWIYNLVSGNKAS
ncbi:MAG TPA: bacteriophage holin [Thermoanaerobaculia bacterium]|nr:bacteriophage holin [Thermoanaerobaculia bacterium]